MMTKTWLLLAQGVRWASIEAMMLGWTDASYNTRAPQTRHRAAENEGLGSGCHGRQQRSGFEDEQAEQEDPLDGEHGVHLAEHELECT